MINFITIIILKFFDFFHQKKIINFIKKQNINHIVNFVDIGSHKGESINIFLNNFKIDNIYAFEPSPINYKSLKIYVKNIIKKYSKTNFLVNNYAIGEEEKNISFKHFKESSSSTTKNINLSSKYFNKKKRFLRSLNQEKFYNIYNVYQKRLDNIFNQNNIEKIDFIKIDTEGNEFNVIKSLGSYIDKVKFIFFEHHYDDMIIKGYTFKDIHSYLSNNNFIQIYKIKMPFRKTFEYIYSKKEHKNDYIN